MTLACFKDNYIKLMKILIEIGNDGKAMFMNLF